MTSDLGPNKLKHALLSKAETYELIAKAQAGDVEARNRVIVHNMRLVHRFVCRIVAKYGLDDDNRQALESNGVFGLIEAVERFDLSRNLSFSTYASHWIHQSIMTWTMKEMRMIRIPSYVYDMRSAIKRGIKKPKRDSGLSAQAARCEVVHSFHGMRKIKDDFDPIDPQSSDWYEQIQKSDDLGLAYRLLWELRQIAPPCYYIVYNRVFNDVTFETLHKVLNRSRQRMQMLYVEYTQLMFNRAVELRTGTIDRDHNYLIYRSKASELPVLDTYPSPEPLPLAALATYRASTHRSAQAPADEVEPLLPTSTLPAKCHTVPKHTKLGKVSARIRPW